MTVLARYAPLGARPYYFSTDGSAHGPTIREVMARRRSSPTWDLEGVRNYLSRTPDGLRTCFEGIHAVPPGHELVTGGSGCALRESQSAVGPHKSLPELLRQVMVDLVADGRRTAVALSGGLDSALVLAILREIGRDDIPVFTLVSGLPGYCERERTSRTAALLGIHPLQIVHTHAEELVSAFPDAIRQAETPLFNLHPVSRWLLASALQREGYEVLLTGDGADPVFAGSDPRNYLPIIGALTRAAGLELRSPFFDERLAAFSSTPNKTHLREAARQWLPDEMTQRPKSATYAPAFDVSAFWNETAIRELAHQLNASPVKTDDPATTTLWTSLGLLAEYLL